MSIETSDPDVKLENRIEIEVMFEENLNIKELCK